MNDDREPIDDEAPVEASNDRQDDDSGGNRDVVSEADQAWDEALADESPVGRGQRTRSGGQGGGKIARRDLLIGGGAAGAVLLGGAIGYNELTGGRGVTGATPPTPTPTVGYGGTATRTTIGSSPTDTDRRAGSTTTRGPTATATQSPTATATPEGLYGGGIGYGENYYGGSPP